MGFKRIDRNLGFADLALASSMEKNRSLSTPGGIIFNNVRGPEKFNSNKRYLLATP